MNNVLLRETITDDLIHGVDEMHIQDLQERQIMGCREFYSDAPATGMHIIVRDERPTLRVTAPPPVRTYMVNGKRPWERRA
jgi:hypothetical protein